MVAIRHRSGRWELPQVHGEEGHEEARHVRQQMCRVRHDGQTVGVVAACELHAHEDEGAEASQLQLFHGGVSVALLFVMFLLLERHEMVVRRRTLHLLHVHRRVHSDTQRW
ncbi:hypothetical protein F441_21370 [Phytophthora nicotianae CJ01A1]|uniref:Uncharacterized protein n=2 Tax=Phytophthora nicotianae TaxID=4792 RepID=V9DZ53_PHYNI|nr:hypothetical protein F443_21484 [Phytophthora nicotianae P1569]ETP01384.1 hypothetical protein F441_21370 [Phytophthora nicotianae CJ01A1]